MVVNGAGTLNLRDEGMLLHLRPMLRAGASLVIPVRVTGTLAAPKIEPDAAGSLATVAGLAPRTSPLGLALAAMVANERSGDVCGPALAAARKLPIPAALLRGLPPR